MVKKEEKQEEEKVLNKKPQLRVCLGCFNPLIEGTYLKSGKIHICVNCGFPNVTNEV